MKTKLFLTTLAVLFLAQIQAQIIYFPDLALEAKLVSDNSGAFTSPTDPSSITIDTNVNGKVEVSEALLIQYLDISNSSLTSIVGIENFTNLIELRCNNNSLTSLALSNLPNLTDLICSNNQLTSLTLQGLPNLNYLNFNGNSNLTTWSLQEPSNLGVLSCAYCNLSSLNVQQYPGLYSFECSGNNLSTLDASNLTFADFYCENMPSLISLFIKNGIPELDEGYNLSNNPNLQYVCVNDESIPYFTNYFLDNGMPNVNVNSYCSFEPGGSYNTISGVVKSDFNTNGCDPADNPTQNLRIDMTQDTSNYSTFTSVSGDYTYYVPVGNYTLTPHLENPSYFNISPVNAVISFTDADNNTQTQHFCVTPNGIHPDLEVVVAPLTTARPGFDATYKIVYKNKGNQTQSGSISLSFNDDLLDLVSTTSSVSASGGTGSGAFLTWDFDNLLPYENRAFEITFNVNTPMDTPPVNNGDILSFTATTGAVPVGTDEVPADNESGLQQVVVNSFDPNDIVCLEGNSVAPTYIGDYLHYIINFENTGTAPAENVVVALEVNPVEYDINTLQLLNTSHPAVTRIKGNKVEFIMEGANLDTGGGHGNVLMKIKTKTDLSLNSIVQNKANIYFDYNFPIVTNDEQTVFAFLSVSDLPVAKNVSVYPVPTTGIVNVEADSQIKSIEVFDAMGRLLQASLNSDTKIDISTQKRGVYFFRIVTEKGLKVEKVLKK